VPHSAAILRPSLRSKGVSGWPDFDFPRDPNSQFNFIDHKATGAAVIRLLAGLEEGFFHDDQHVRSLMRGDIDWPITPILKVGAACAFLKKLAAFIRQRAPERLASVV
jgi:hypothetical protein